MELVREFVPRAEELGYHSLWVQEQILGDVSALEPISLLCYAAALSRDLRLGTSVLLAPLRNPVQLAKALASLDQMSGGRLIVGVGLGGQVSYYPAFGLSPEGRVRRMVESLEVMKALWTEPSARLEGRFWHLDGTTMEPKPAQKPHPPIWFGGHHPSALRRAVRQGDGWMGAGSSSTEHFKERAGLLRTYLEEQGRDPSTFVISKRVYIAVDDDEQRAERRLQQWFGRRYKNEALASQVSVWGSSARCVEGLSQVVRAGAQLLVLNPVFDEMEHLRWMAEEVVPHL